jgi:hypothetical protein
MDKRSSIMDAWADGGFNPLAAAHWVGEAKEATVLKDVATTDYEAIEFFYSK